MHTLCCLLVMKPKQTVINSPMNSCRVPWPMPCAWPGWARVFLPAGESSRSQAQAALQAGDGPGVNRGRYVITVSFDLCSPLFFSHPVRSSLSYIPIRASVTPPAATPPSPSICPSVTFTFSSMVGVIPTESLVGQGLTGWAGCSRRLPCGELMLLLTQSP